MDLKKIAIAAACVLLLACESQEERVESYLSKAEALFDEQEYVAAKLEAMNAAQIDPKNADVRMLLAKLAMRDRDFREAVTHVMIASETDPQMLEPKVLLGSLYYTAGNQGALEEQLLAAQQIAPDDPAVILMNAQAIYLRDGKEPAMAEFAKLEALGPLSDEAVAFKANAVYRTGDIDGALAVLDRQIAQAENLRASQYLLSYRLLVLRSAGREAEIEKALIQLAELFPESEEPTENLVAFYLQRGRVDDAEPVLRALIERDPESVERRIGLAEFVASYRSPDEAVELLRGYVAERPDDTALRVSLGHLYDSIDRLDDAVDAYQGVADIAPVSPDGIEARTRIASIRLRQGRPDEARSLIEGIIADAPDAADALLSRAYFEFRDGNYEAVIADARIAARKEPDSTEALLYIARSHEKLGETVLAIDAFRKLLALDPANPAGATELAEILTREGDAAAAQDVLRARLKAQQQDGDATAALVRALLADGDIGRAETEARRLMEIEPDSGRGDLEYARVMQAQSQNAEAIAALEKALDRNPDSLEALDLLVNIWIQAGDFDTAAAFLTDFAAQQPGNLRARFLLARAELRRGNRDAAVEHLEFVIAKQPSLEEPYLILAGMNPAGSPERVSALERGVAAIPSSWNLALRLGTQYALLGRSDDAIEVYERSLAVADSDPVANNLAVLLLDQRSDEASHAQALDLVARFRASDFPPALDTLGWAHYRNGNFVNAVSYLERAVAGVGATPEMRYHLGMAYLETQDSLSARRQLETALAQANAGAPWLGEASAALSRIAD